LGATSAQVFETTPADGTGSIATFMPIPISVGAVLSLLASLGRSCFRGGGDPPTGDWARATSTPQNEVSNDVPPDCGLTTTSTA
jgi:hypothetical protein